MKAKRHATPRNQKRERARLSGKAKRHATHRNQRRERASPSRGRVYNKVYNKL